MNFMDPNRDDALLAAHRPAPFGTRARFALPDHDHSLIDMREVLAIARRGKWILALSLVVCVGSALAYLSVAKPEFVASTQVILESRRIPVPQDSSATSATALDSAQAESQIQVVKSERVLAFVFDTLKLADSPAFAHPAPGLRQRLEDSVADWLPVLRPVLLGSRPPSAEDQRSLAFQAFADRVGVRRIGQSYVLEISYRAASPAEAARFANSVTAAYIRDQIGLKAAAALRGSEFLQGRIADIKQEQDAAFEAVRLGTTPTILLPDSDARIISAAREPLSKSYPQTLLILGMGLLSGLFIGCLILAVRHSLDRRIRSAHQLWRVLGLEGLATIPHVRRGLRGRVPFDFVMSDPNAPFSKSLRAAYTSMTAASLADDPHRAIGVVSWLPGEGKSTIAGNLARFIAASGGTVSLIDADLQDSALSRTLAPDAASGLCEALSNGDGASGAAMPLARNLAFLSARGRLQRPNPNIFLGSPEMRKIVAGRREHGDVVVDLPALSQGSHAQAVSRFLDGVVLVVQLHRTTTDEVALAIRTLQNAQAVLLGVVLNRGPARTRA